MTDKIAPLARRQWWLLLLSLVLLWPALVNGGPFYFADTSAYVRGVDAAVYRATGHASVWTESVVAPARAPTATTPPASAAPPRAEAAKPVLLGRSVYYGVIPYVATLAGWDWWTIVLQALVGGGIVIGLARHFVDPRRRGFVPVVVAAVAVSAAGALPFFVTMLMPDFLAGAGIVAAAALIAGWHREGRGGRAAWFALAAAAALTHSANVLILLGVAAPALAYALLRRNGAVVRGAILVTLAAAAGLAGEALFAQAVTRITGAAPIRPPFLAARLIEDGPGLAYLDAACPDAGFVLCRYRDRMPHPSDTFLWSANPREGVFSTAPADTRRALAAEQGRFVAAVTAARPLDVAAASSRAVARQVGEMGLAEFNYPRQGHLERMPAAVLRDIVPTRAYRRTMPVGAIEALLWPSLFLSLAVIGAALASPAARRYAGYGAAVVLGWLANDVACGALSTPHERYQARVVWVLPLVALLTAVAWWRARRAAT